MNKLQKIQSANIDLFKTYLKAIHGSINTKMFKHLYQKRGSKVVDIYNLGDVSCAAHVSSILYLWGLIGDTHATVKSTINDMEAMGWEKINKPRTGCVVVWPADENFKHTHIGFFIGKNQVISNSSKKGTPVMHHYTYGKVKGKPKRRITAMYWHKALEK